MNITALLQEKKQLQSRIQQLDNDIYALRQSCPHDGEIEYRTRTLDRLMYADTYRAANAVMFPTNQREIQKRTCTCVDCGQSWDEMRFSDSDWMPINDWLDKFNR